MLFVLMHHNVMWLCGPVINYRQGRGIEGLQPFSKLQHIINMHTLIEQSNTLIEQPFTTSFVNIM